MWPEKKESIKNQINQMKIKAKSFKRKINFGLRVHVIVRETENEAREYAKKIISKLDLSKGEEIKNRALDARSLGVFRQSQMIKESDSEYFVEDSLWTGIGLARSGCGAAILGHVPLGFTICASPWHGIRRRPTSRIHRPVCS